MSADTILEMYVVYCRPRDYPDKFVMRRWTLDRGGASSIPTDWFVSGDSIEDVRAHVPLHCVRIGRSPGDDPVILETWL